MQRRWIVAALVGAALVIGTAFGPAVVQAATAGLVRLEGAGTHHVAKVSRSGQLSVTDGTHHTKAGQVQVATAAPAQAVTKFLSALTCSSGGNYTVPHGKALIITGVTFYNHATTPGNNDEQDLFIGRATSPCTKFVAAGIDSSADQSLPETFDPGIAVPAGDAVGGASSGDSGSTVLYGYLVPARDVPASAATAPLHHRPGSSSTTK